MQGFCILNNGETSESSRLMSERYEVLTDVTTKTAFQDVLPYSWQTITNVPEELATYSF
jgi:hypothetical protein